MDVTLRSRRDPHHRPQRFPTARLLTTQAGDIELRIPKLRKGSFFPSILEPRRRIDQALYAVVMEAYVNGVSTRAVDNLVEALGSNSTPTATAPSDTEAATSA